MAKRGPKSKYDEKFHPVIVKWLARAGKIDAEIASEIGISVSQLHRWKLAYPEIRESIKEGKNFPDASVEDSLYRAANGYESEGLNVKEVKTVIQNPDGSTSEKTVTTRFKSKIHVPPNVTACIYWTKNRRPNEWRERQEPKGEGDPTAEYLEADATLDTAKVPCGTVPAVLQHCEIQDSAGGQTFGQDGAGEAEAHSDAVGLPGGPPAP